MELSLGDAEKDGRRLNVSDFALKAYRAAYKDAKLCKEDISNCVYGILYSPEYKMPFTSPRPSLHSPKTHLIRLRHLLPIRCGEGNRGGVGEAFAWSAWFAVLLCVSAAWRRNPVRAL